MTRGRDNAPRTGHDSRPAGDGPAPCASRFQALARALTDQLDAARRGRLERVAELAQRVDALLAGAREAGAALSDADRRRLLDLHGQVRLTLAQQQTELARRRERLKRGKRGARAYAASPGPRGG
ncbi:MAG: hypothetical protein U9R68_07005 [Planctomycetota bacterium]|nr:hypothetical protein [Planctomycetota bacterium]